MVTNILKVIHYVCQLNSDLPGLSGLGTSTAKEAKEYFSDMLRHRIPFKYSNAEDDTAIELVTHMTFCFSLLVTLCH